MSQIKNFGELQPGDFVMGSAGEPVEVLKVYDEHIPDVMWEIELDNGETIKASGNHLWYCETQLDWELHSLRKQEAKKLFAHIPAKTIELLEEAAGKKELVETSLIDMVTLVQAVSDNAMLNQVERIAESLGHISENTTTLDALDDFEEEEETIRYYDARLFAQQILALTGKRKYKKFPVVVGSIMTTDQMMELSETVTIPVSNPLA